MMNLTYYDLHDALVEAERAIREVGLDVDNVFCAEPKCLLTDKLAQLRDQYLELSELEIEFCELNLGEILARIQHCFKCIRIDADLPTDLVELPEPVREYGECAGSTLLTIDDIYRFRVYEHSNNKTEVYVVPKAQLPFDFVTPVPSLGLFAGEHYYLSWNQKRQSLVIRATAEYAPRIAPGDLNIGAVVAELSAHAREAFGVSEVTACTVLQTTEGVPWATDPSIIMDGNYSTHTRLSDFFGEVSLEFQFKV